MIAIKNPKSDGLGAGTKSDIEYLQNNPSCLACQPCMPLPWPFRSNPVKSLVFQRYADILNVCVGLL